MQEKRRNSKALIVGIVGAVIVLAALLALVLTQCNGTGSAPATQPAVTVAPTEVVDETYELYWNLDRAEYDGKSEAGMSSRPMGSDGYFHIRMFRDGEEVTVKTSDRKVVNFIDTIDLMGLVFDENGYVIEAIDLEDLPLDTAGWRFYVQSVGGKIVKLNSSDSFEGMELLLECNDNTGIYDMTGLSGPVGCEATPITFDRVYPIMNMKGEVTHIFLYDRSNFMLTHEADCQHCGEKVTWYEWAKTDELPTKSGHYQLTGDINLKGQMSMGTDAKICLDLNGFTVEGKDNTRLYSIHNAGGALAIMDTSEAQTGRMVGHAKSSPQGGIVWVRYGQFHLYSGTLDGSDMISRLNGTVVQVPKAAFFYMHGGTIIGGTAAPQYNEETKAYTYGLGGSIQVAGTFRMYGGEIRGGNAPAAYYYKDGKLTLSRGMGGNIFLSSGAVMEMTDGKILYGHAGNVGANIMMDGTAELIISGGEISGGWTDDKVANKNGANVYCPAKGKIEMSGGVIEGGHANAGGGGNIYLAGTMTMRGGHIFGGVAATSGGNIMMASSAKLTIYAGTIRDGVCNGQVAGQGGGNIHMGGTAPVLKIYTAIITGGVANGLVNEDGTTVGGDGGNININRGTLSISGGTISGGKATGNGDGVYIGWNSVGMELSGKAKVYGNEGVDICRSSNTNAEKSQFFIGAWNGNGELGAAVIERMGAVAGNVLGKPQNKVTLTEEDVAKFASNRFVLPLALSEDGNLILSETATLGEVDHSHCLCGGKIEGHSCEAVGFTTLTAAEFAECWASGSTASSLLGSLNICLGEDVTLTNEFAIAGATLNLCLHGHTIHMSDNARITANGVSGVLNITDCTGSGKILAEEGCRASFLYTYKGVMNIYGGTVDGANLAVGLGPVRVGYAGDIFNLYNGTIIGSKRANNGGSIYCDVAGTVNIYNGTVRDGVATSAGGGNIFLNNASAVLNIYGGTISGGKATATATGSGLGGNIHVIKGAMAISGGTITGGSANGVTSAGEPVGATGGVYAAYHAGTFTLKGDAKIYGNSGSDIWLTSKASYVANLDNWNGNGDKGALVIGKTTAAAGTLLVSGAVKADAAKFVSAVNGLVVKYDGSKLILATPFVHDHCICAGKVEGHTCTTTSFVEVENADDFKALFASDNTLLESVNIALTGSFTLDAEYKTAGKNLNICLNGQTITMSGNGRITASGNSEVSITDCGDGKIVAAAGARQSFLYVYNGVMNLFAGTVDAGAIVQTTASSGNSGGAVTLWNSTDAFNMYGGTIIGAKLYRAGGVYVYDGLFTMYGGTIRDGYANVGGNVATDRGNFTMLGGTITGGTAEVNGAGVFCGYWSTGKLTLGGDAKIYGNNGAQDVYCGQQAAANNFIILDGWQGNGASGALTVGSRSVKNGAVIAEAKFGTLTDAELGMLASAHEGLALALNADGKIVFEEIVYHKHCVCNGTVTGNDSHTCAVLTFTEVTGEEFLALFDASGLLTADATVCLTGSVELAKEYKLDGHTLTLCLNGQTITMSGSGRISANGNGGTLNLADCGDGKIVAAEGATPGLLYSWNGNINVYGGTVDASACKAGNGGTVTLGNTNDKVTIYGGTFIGNEKSLNGGNFYSSGAGVLTVYGGNILGGKANASKADNGLGGLVHMAKGQLIVLGGTFTGGSADGKPNATATAGMAGGIYIPYNGTMILGGNAKIYGNAGSDIYLTSRTDKVVLTLQDWAGNGDEGALKLVKLDAVAGTQLVGATVKAEDVAKFESVLEGTTFELDANGGISLKQLHYHCICNGKLESDETHTCQKALYTELDAAGFLALFNEERKLTASHTVVLTEDVTLDAEYALNGNTLTLCLGGKTINMTGNGRITANGTTGVLNMTDCGEGKILAAEGTRAGILYTYKGVMNIYGGTVDAAKCASAASGAITVGYAGDVLNIYGGTIIGSKKSTGGGSIYMNADGTINIYGGIVKDGVANAGGNIYLTNGKTYIKGGTIENGSAGYGGNILVYKTAQLFVQGGTISGGSSTGTTSGYGGGNIFCGTGSETTGGIIISGGTISDGTAVLDGGNININRGYLTVTGGTITTGSAQGNGGGIYVGWNGTGVTLSGNALVYGNEVTDICRSANTSTSKGTFLLGDWAGNGTNGAAKFDSLFTATGKTVVAAASGYTITAEDIAKFQCVGTYGMALNSGKLVTAAK